MHSSVALYTGLRRHANKVKKLEHKLYCNTGHPVVPLHLSAQVKAIILYRKYMFRKVFILCMIQAHLNGIKHNGIKLR